MVGDGLINELKKKYTINIDTESDRQCLLVGESAHIHKKT